MTLQKTSIAIAVSLALGCVGNAHADQASDMQAKLDALQKQVQELQAQMAALRKKQEQAAPAAAAAPAKAPANRSEERRVGKECRSRWAVEQEKKKEETRRKISDTQTRSNIQR